MAWQNSIRAVIFDLFHTLTSLEVACAPGAHTADILRIDREVWNRHWLSDPPDYCLGLVPVEIPIARLARQLNPDVTEKQITEALSVRHQRFRHALVNIETGTLDGLNRLRALGYKLGLISNCGADEIAHWQESPLASLFDTVLFSCYVKLKKPDPAIYRLAAKNLDVRTAECLYVGNGGSNELKGAQDAGMMPVLLTYHLELIKPERILNVLPDARVIIRTVKDLLLLLNLKH
ncbi:MAG: HAD family hydrolase [bacterium]